MALAIGVEQEARQVEPRLVGQTVNLTTAATALVDPPTVSAPWEEELEAITMEVQIPPGQEVAVVAAALSPLTMQPTVVVVAPAAATQLAVVAVEALEMEATPPAQADPVLSVVIPSLAKMQAVAVGHPVTLLVVTVEMQAALVLTALAMSL
jgi:hypothetical protein